MHLPVYEDGSQIDGFNFAIERLHKFVLCEAFKPRNFLNIGGNAGDELSHRGRRRCGKSSKEGKKRKHT